MSNYSGPTDEEMARYALKCTSHHHACDCREWRYRKMEVALEQQRSELLALRELLTRHGLLLEADTPK